MYYDEYLKDVESRHSVTTQCMISFGHQQHQFVELISRGHAKMKQLQ